MTVTAGRPPENHEFQWAIRDDAIRMNSGYLSTPDLFRPPASHLFHRISKSPSHAQRRRMRFVDHVPKDGMPVGGQRALFVFSDQNDLKKVMSSLKHDRRRLFLFSWHTTQKEATASANETRLGMYSVSYATGAAALTKIHGAERAHWPMACRDRVLCATPRAACMGLTRASAPSGFGFEAPTSNCA